MIHSIVTVLLHHDVRTASLEAVALALLTGAVTLISACVTSARLRLIDALTQVVDESTIRALGAVHTIEELAQPACAHYLTILKHQQGAVGRSLNVWIVALVNLTSVFSLFAAAFLVSPWLFLAPLLALPQVYLGVRSQRIAERAIDDAAPHAARIDALLQPVVHGRSGDELRLLGGTEFYRAKIAGLGKQWLAPQRKATRLIFLVELAGALLATVGLGLSLFLVMRTASVAAMAAAAFVLVRLARTGGILYYTMRMVEGTDRAVVRWCNLISLDDSVMLPDLVLHSDKNINLDHVFYSFLDGHTVLHDVSCTLPLGQTVAIVGENGSGKTTLGALLLGLRTPTSGSIHVPPHDQAAMVPQEGARLPATVANNIGVGLVVADETIAKAEQTRAALAKAHLNLEPLSTFLHPQPQAQQRGLSGGQWKRISIARAQLRTDAVIQVYDEANAALDPANAALVTDSLLTSPVAPDHIRFVITRQLGTARQATTIMVLDQGKLVGLGIHDDLMRPGVCPHYVALYESQSRGYR